MNHAASQAFPRITGRLRPVVIGILVDDHRFTDDVLGPETVVEKTHPGISVVGKQDGEVTGMVAVRLLIRVPVLTGILKGVLRISHLARAVFMNMKTVGTDGVFSFLSRLIARKTSHLDTYLGPALDFLKPDGSSKLTG